MEAAVGKYFGNAIEAQVTFSRDGSAFYRADIAVHVGRGIDLHGHASADDPIVAFELAHERIAKRLRRTKRRLRDHKGAAAGAAEPQPDTEAPGVSPDRDRDWEGKSGGIGDD